MTPQKGTLIPKYKLDTVKELAELVKTKKTILIASIKNIPASQFQEIGKKLRGKAIIKVPKKNLIYMAIDSKKDTTLEKLKEKIGENVAILFSDLDSFELAWELEENKSPSKAKAGQEAPEDIEIPGGPTELVPGPAISELGALGIKIQIEKGKIHIKEPKIIAKKGTKISSGAAEIMGKLDIKPFSVGFIPLASFDTQEKKLYLEIKIDKEKTVNNLKIDSSKALAFAVKIVYSTQETIKFLINKAHSHFKSLENLKPSEEVKQESEVKEELEEVKQGSEEKIESKEKETNNTSIENLEENK